ncbi:hypothetical protein, partial [Microvirga tunisiensis]
MSTRFLTQDEAMRLLVTQIRKHLIGHEAAVMAFAAEICRHIAAGSAQRRPGIVLVAGPSIDGEHLGLPTGLAACFKSSGGRYELGASQGEDLAHMFASLADGAGVHSLLRSARDNPNAVFVLQDIDKARPSLVKALVNAWSQGFLEDEGGEEISLGDAIFVLTTDVAQEQIGRIAREEADPDRLHVRCLKALLDAGVPASLLKSIDTVVALRTMTPGEAVLEHHRSFAEQIASHGLVLVEGGIDGRVLAHSIDSSIEPDIQEILSANSLLAIQQEEDGMSLHPEPIGEIPAETVRVARAAFPKG